MISRYHEVVRSHFGEIAETSRNVTNLRAQFCPETNAWFHSYFSDPELPWVAVAQSGNPSTWSLLWSDRSHSWVGSNPGEAKIIIFSSSNKLRNKSKKSKWSRDISNQFGSHFVNSQKNRKPTNFACPILSQKGRLWYIPEPRESFTLRSAEVIKQDIIFVNLNISNLHKVIV